MWLFSRFRSFGFGVPRPRASWGQRRAPCNRPAAPPLRLESLEERNLLSVLQFSSATYSVMENGGSAAITVVRTDGSQGAVSVNYSTSDGSALEGPDYFGAFGLLTFASGQTSRTFTVNIQDDNQAEGNETVNLTLSTPGGGATLGALSTAVLTIVDNESGQGGTGILQFSSATYSANENGGGATITVSRTGGSLGTVSVNVASSDGSATAGLDYQAVFGSLTFFNGEVSKSFTVPLFDDLLAEGNETVNLSLSSPTGGATLGFPSTAVLTIVDDETGQVGTGSLQFSSATYSVTEIGGSATITVSRTGGSLGTVSVNVATSNGSATAGLDYGQTFGTLTFFNGEVSKTFTIPVFDDFTVEGDETVNLTLSNPFGGATLGFPSTAVLTIVDNETGQAGSLQFSATSYSATENGGSATITVTRTGGSGGTVSVNYATSDGSATNGLDYVGASGTLTFFSGEDTKTFTVSVLGDSLVEGTETVNLTLSNPTGGATLGFPNTAVVTIVDSTSAATPTLFDFGTATSPLAAGYTRVTGATLYTQARGYGWLENTAFDRERGTGNDLTRDLNFVIAQGTFVVNVPNGQYQVSLLMGDSEFTYDMVGIFLEGVRVATVDLNTGQFITPTFNVTVSDGQLTLMLRDLGGSNSLAPINALAINAGNPFGSPGPGNPNPGPTPPTQPPFLPPLLPPLLPPVPPAGGFLPPVNQQPNSGNFGSASLVQSEAAPPSSGEDVAVLGKAAPFQAVEIPLLSLFPGSSDAPDGFSLFL